MNAMGNTDTMTLTSKNWFDNVKALVREGNRRKVNVSRHGEEIVRIPLTLGVIAAVIAPPFTAVAVLIALLTDCSIKVERAAAEPDEFAMNIVQDAPVTGGPL